MTDPVHLGDNVTLYLADCLWRAETDAYIALEAAIEPLMEEVRECH